MKKEFTAGRLDVSALAHEGATLSGQKMLGAYSRLLAETQGAGAERQVAWSARGEWREAAGRPGQPWLHLEAHAELPLTCQRCLAPVDVEIDVQRSFRFVADERTAEQEDDDSEEDLLVLEKSFDLLELVEDELLLELPPVPRHVTCPADLKLAVADEEFDAAAREHPNPFAALSQLKGRKGN